MRKITTISALAALTATGPLADLHVANTGLCRTAAFGFFAKSSNGTTPTLDVKWQSSPLAVAGYSQATTGATDNKLKAGASTTVKLGAQFTQSGAKSLKYLRVVLNKIGTITAGQTVTVELYADSAGSPTGSALASATIDIDSQITTTYDSILVTFATAPDLADAAVYHIVLSASYTASATNCVQWRSLTVASAGNFEAFDGTSTWTDTTTQSLEVLTYFCVFSDIAGSNATQVATTASQQEYATAAGILPAHVRPYATIGGASTPTFYVGTYVNSELTRA